MRDLIINALCNIYYLIIINGASICEYEVETPFFKDVERVHVIKYLFDYISK